MRFENGGLSLKEKVTLLANIHQLPMEYIWNEYSKISDTQMTEIRKWQYINSCINNRKGYIYD